MRKLRALSCVLLACFISCTTLGSAFASGILIDDLPIDPWGDLEDVENYEPPEPSDPNFSDPYFTPEVLPSEDNGGVSFFSLNDDITSRTLYISKSIKVGNKSAMATFSAGSYSFTYNSSSSSHRYSPLTYQVVSTSALNVILQIPAGTYFEITAPVSYSPESVENLILGGGGKFGVRGTCANSLIDTDWSYPATVQLLVNGSLYGEAVSISTNGLFDFSYIDIPVDEEITSLGYRFTYTSAVNLTKTSTTSGTNYNAVFYFDDTSVFTVEELPEEPEYNGLLDTIIGWLRNIWDGIKSIGQSILDGLEGLFVPSESDIVEIKEMYSALLEERLGFVYEAFVMLDDAFDKLKTAFESGNGYTFTFPGISFPMNGEIITIVEEQEINMENEFMDTVRPVFGTIVCLFSVAGVVRTGADMVVAIISGVSPFAFYRKADEIWETLWGEDS